MSFGTSVGDIIAVCQLANKLRKDFVNAQGQLKTIHAELKGLSHVLQDLEDVLSEQDLNKRRENDLCEILEGCHNLLNQINDFVAKNSIVETDPLKLRGKVRRVWKQLKWNPQEANDFRARIASQAALLCLFASSITNDTLFTVRDGIQTIQEGIQQLNLQQNGIEHEKFLEWVSIEDYSLQQLDFLSRREEGTGQWLLDSDEFQQWESTRQATLFCPGIPGGGKTIIASIVVDRLQSQFGDDDRVGIAFLYCNFRRRAEQSARDLLGSLLRQLLARLPTVPESMLKIYEECEKKKRKATFQEIVDGLRAVIGSLSRCFLVVDALDESQVSRDGRDRFLTELFKLQESTNANIFATSRHIPDIESRFDGALKVEIRGNKDDIRRYLVSSLPMLRSFVARNQDLQDQILDVISTSVDGMFLLAQLHMQSLQEKTTAKAIRVALSTVPSLNPGTSTSSGQSITPKARAAYDHAYEEAMERITTQHPDSRDLAVRVLSWISRAKRPLQTRELRHALAVEEEENFVDPDNIPALEDMISVCAGLAIVDEQSDIIRLVHYTTQEYFERSWTHWFPGGEEDMGRTCLRYLLFDPQNWAFHDWSLSCRGRDLHDSQPPLEESQPFYDYAVKHWGLHCRNSSLDGDLFLFDFFEKEPNIEKDCGDPSSNHFTLYPCDPILLSAFFGLYKTCEHLVSHGAPVNSGGSDLVGPIHIAVYMGHLDIVQLLLDAGASPNQTFRGKSPFYIATMRENVLMMDALIEAGADPNRKADGRTPFVKAALDGGVKTVEFLLQCETVELDIESWYGLTPLVAACKTGQSQVVSILLDAARDLRLKGLACPSYLDVNYKDSGGFPALYYAIIGDHAQVVSLLVETGQVDTNQKLDDGRTPLFYAFCFGNERVISLLLAHASHPCSVDDVDSFNRIDDKRDTPLLIATKWLLQNGRHCLGLFDDSGSSPVGFMLMLLNAIIRTRERDKKAHDLNNWYNDRSSFDLFTGLLTVALILIHYDDETVTTLGQIPMAGALSLTSGNIRDKLLERYDSAVAYDDNHNIELEDLESSELN